MVNSSPGNTVAGVKFSIEIGSVKVSSVFVVISPLGVLSVTSPGCAS